MLKYMITKQRRCILKCSVIVPDSTRPTFNAEMWLKTLRQQPNNVDVQMLTKLPINQPICDHHVVSSAFEILYIIVLYFANKTTLKLNMVLFVSVAVYYFLQAPNMLPHK